MKTQNASGYDWWLGVADVLTQGISQGAQKLERVHLSIADETFDLLSRSPITRPWSEVVRTTHHSITRLSYRSVATVATHTGQLLSDINGNLNS
ncbi:hypothetical protein [Marinobacter sp.]|uniref:hypothetical protein n=1 Tax=Marinobacter sp. TaxID=50741 RepID=UPI0034A493E3